MDKVKKVRLDTFLVEQGLFESRARAQAAIMAGQVLVDEQKIDKPGTPVKAEAKIRLLGDQLKYVSRGGLKLEKALQVFPVTVAGKVMADIGASTGGFTDCALQNGASKVYAIDVGYGQLAWKLRAASIDVAFISLDKILPAVKKLLAPGAFVLALVKPQFEAGKEHIGKKGVVRDPEVHREVIRRIIDLAGEEGFGIGGLDFSPVKGPEGNIEYLLYLTASPQQNTVPDIDTVVAASHAELDK